MARQSRAYRLICLTVVVAAFIAGCGPKPTPKPIASVIPAQPPLPPPPPPINYKLIRPNEVGYIPVLMYHSFGDPAMGSRPRYDRGGLNIRPDTFRKQLEMMYEANWYPVNMRDALSPHLDIPAGKIPVALTFDDARGSQFYYRKDGSLDPDCAVAILEQFHETHPDWPLKGTFYVLPKSKWNPVPFYQPGKEGEKLKHLAEDGFEIANHSTSHNRMDRMDAHRLAWEMAECIRYVRKFVPNATMDTMALPMGYKPRGAANYEVVLKGADNGTAYENKCIMEAWGDVTYAPANKKFDRRHITRMSASPGYIEAWIKRLKPGAETPAYVSDGDPNSVAVPKSQEKFVDPKRLEEAKLVAWDDTPPKKDIEKKAHVDAGKKVTSKEGDTKQISTK